MSFKSSSPNQSFLLPPNYGDFLGESHEAVVLNEFMKEVDTSGLKHSYRNQYGGRAAYHPEMILTVLIYAYMNGIFSSRKIAKSLRQDLAFMYLAGNETPDFRTLARFRKDKGRYMEGILAEVVHKAQALGLVSFDVCSLDGTKIYANAGKEKNLDKNDFQDKIRGLMEKAEDADAKEDELYGENEDDKDPELKTKAGRARRKGEIKAKKINTTDPDSKLMQMKRKDYANGYNVQSVTENGIILSSSIFNTSADQNTLIPTVEKLQRVHQTPEKILADKGYSTQNNYSFCEERGIDAYIPTSYSGADPTNYSYDKKSDTYTDQKGRIFFFKQHSGKLRGAGPWRKRKDHSFYRSTVYEHRDSRTGKKKYLSVSPVWQRHIRKQKEKLSTSQGKLIYRQRMYDVEGVFANIKRNLKFTSFLLRGFIGVSIEWNLISLAHNLKKII